MKIQIICSTKSGTVHDCAELLAREFKTHIFDIYDMSSYAPRFEEYDITVIGFYIRYGKCGRELGSFFKKYYDELKNCKCAYYICCGYIDYFDEYAKKSIPEELYGSAIDIGCFGGEFNLSRVKGIEKMILRSMRNDILGGGENGDQREGQSLPTILDGNIAQFADKIKRSCL